MKKNSIIFLHLPKNGGTTFHSILNRVYSSEKIFSLTYNGKESNKSDFINMPLEERLSYRLFKGHAPFGIHDYMNKNTKYITFLRKPEERIKSFYYYVLRKPYNKLYKQIQQDNLSLYDFVTQVNSPDLNNCQVRWISGINDKGDLMLEKAIHNINNQFSFVGLTEKFNESLIYLKQLYGWSVPYYQVKNKSSNKQRIIDTKTLNAINEYNKYDNQLYDYIEKEFVIKMKGVDNLNLELFKLEIFNLVYANSFSRRIAGKLKRIIY